MTRFVECEPIAHRDSHALVHGQIMPARLPVYAQSHEALALRNQRLRAGRGQRTCAQRAKQRLLWVFRLR